MNEPLLTKSIISLCIIFRIGFGGTLSFAQIGEWQWFNPLPQNNNLRKVFFCNKEIGWAIGEFGTIIHTKDGGKNWKKQSSMTAKHLNDAYFIDVHNGWVVGDSGTILFTKDSGDSWTPIESGISENFLHTHFLDIEKGWVAGNNGIILHTSDGGNQWLRQSAETNTPLTSLHFTDITNGWAVGSASTMIHYTNLATSINDNHINRDLATHFSLMQNYPNPFTRDTYIQYDLYENAHVELTMFDILGRRVKTLVDCVQAPGYRTIYWNSKDKHGTTLSSGIYFYQLKSGNYSETCKMLILKK